MANLTPTPSFDPVVQLETTTVALGGAGAPMNLQAQALLNRTQYLFVQLSNLATVATTGDYNSLINRPSLGSAAFQNSSAFATAAQGAKADGAAQVSALATVAFSGSYTDLSNKPALIPEAPTDGQVYGRKNSAWVVVSGISGGVVPSVNGISAAVTITGISGVTVSTAGSTISVSGAGLATAGYLSGVNDQTGTSYTVASSDAGKDIRCTNASAITLNIDTAANSGITTAGFWALVSQGGAGTVTIAALAGVTLRTPNGSSTSAQYDARGIEYLGSNEWRVW